MSSTSTPKRKRPKHSLSVLPVEETDQRGNAKGEGTLKEGSRSLLSREETDQRDNIGGGEVSLEESSQSLLLREEVDQKVALKKGPWTKEEDEILVDHIKKYGEGNWKAVQKNSGLARDGKSCRLRWANHLRSGLKRGSFTTEEERLILEFHFLKGSKWAKMAALLPGRTDNEIKNFWYTRSRKRQRAGLPIYPDEISSKCSLTRCQEITDTSANEASRHDETEKFNLDITNLDLKDFKFRPDMLPPYFDTQHCELINDLVGRRSDPSHNTISTRPSMCPRVAVVRHKYLIRSRNVAVPRVFNQYGQYPMMSTPCDPILNTNLRHGYDNPTTGFHAMPNIASSQPIYGSMRLEPPSFESVDTPVQAPPIESCLPVPASSDCNHLINPTVYYNSDQNLKGPSIDSLQANIDRTAPNEAEISTQWNELNDDQHTALVTHRQINFLRWVRSRRNFLRWTRSEIETPQS